MVTTTNLISYYKFDENAASTSVADAHGSNNLTSSTNTSNLSVTGKINTAFDFNGTSEEVSGSFSQTFNALSYSWWMAWDDSGTSNTQVIFESETTAEGLVYTGSGTTDSIAVRLNTGLTDAVFDSAIPDANWHHYLVTWDGTNVRLYVDGSEHTSSPISRAWSSPTFSSLNIASRGGSSVWFNGRIDEVGIWIRALTSTEADELYNSGNGLAYPFSSDVTVSPSTLTLSMVDEEPRFFLDVLSGSFELGLNLLTPTLSGMDIPTSIGSKYIATRYPVVEGLIAGTTKQTGNPNLVETNPQTSW